MHVVPLTSTLRQFHSEITIEPDDHNGLTVRSAAQCQHLRAVSTGRIVSSRGQRRGHDARSDPGDGRSHARHPYLTSTNTLKEFTKDGTPLSFSSYQVATSFLRCECHSEVTILAN